MEREFDLKFYGHFSIEEIRAMDVRKIDWFHGRLSKQLTDIENATKNE